MKKTETEIQLVNLPGGGKSIVEWCRPLWMNGADPRRPLRLEVAATVMEPNAMGMAEGAEASALDDLEFLIRRLLPRGARAEHAMSISGAGEKVYVYYLRPRLGLLKKRAAQEVLDPALARLAASAGRPVRVSWIDDPEWSKLLGVFPAYDPDQWKTDQAMVVHMAKASDAIHARRVVVHRAYFDDRDACRAFLKDVRRLKFKAEGGPKQVADGRFVALVERLEPTIATWHLHPVVLSVKQAALAQGGTYHGWETELIKSLVPPPLTAPSPKG